jgi:hypothetical protein
MTDLVSRVRARASSDEPTDEGPPGRPARPPAGPGSVAKTEAALGHNLPPLLTRLLTEVGNGGFGPDYGLLGIDGGAANEDGRDALALYLVFREPDEQDPHWHWPAGLLPLVHCGCAMFLCVDCTSRRGDIVWFEPNPHEDGQPWDDSFIPLGCDLEQLLESWLAGEAWLDRLDPGA